MYKKFMHIFSYLIFGVLTTVINLVSYKIFLDLNIDYRVSATLAFILAVLFAFITNRKYVFTAQSSILKEAVAFLSMRLVTFAINLIGLIIMVDFIHLDKFYSQVALNVLIIILNYVLSKYIVFNLRSIKKYLKLRGIVFGVRK